MSFRVRNALVIALLAGLSSAQTPAAEPLMKVKAIEVIAVSEAEEQLLRSRLPIHEGALTGRTELGASAKMVRELDAYLTFKFEATTLDDGSAEVTIRITGVGIWPATVFIQEPVLIRRVEPEYPESLQAQGVIGSIELAGTIGLDGAVRDVAIVSGDTRLADAASKAVLQWRYRPALADAQPIEVRRNIALRLGAPAVTFNSQAIVDRR